MDHLERKREAQREAVIADVSAERLARGKHQRRPEALAAAHQRVRQRLDQSTRAGGLPGRDESPEVGLDAGRYLPEVLLDVNGLSG